MQTLADAAAALRTLDPNAKLGAWTPAQVVVHCAQSIEFSVSGFPQLRSALFRATAGRLAAALFLRRNRLGHDLAAPIPGAPEPARDTSFPDALARFDRAVATFDDTPEDRLAPHFAYGRQAKAAYARLHVLHVADHLKGA